MVRMADQDVRNAIVEKMLTDGVTGSHNKQIDTIVSHAVATHDRGRAKEEMQAMIADREVPVEKYGGQRDTVRLSSVKAAVEYLKANGGDVPFGYD